MSEPIRPGRVSSSVLACLLLVVQAGCTSALTTAYLREGLWSGAEHAASAEPVPEGQEAARSESDTTATEPDAVADRDRREAALGEAMSRLSRLGPIDPAVEAALVATLQRTVPEDWPVVVEEFAASLAAAEATISVKPPADDDAGETLADDPVGEPARPAVTEDETAPETAAANETADAAPATTLPEGPTDDAECPPAEGEPLAGAPAAEPPTVRKACFASAVRAWGDVDRYATDRFRPGQEVIVYVELDNLAAGTSPAGHTTCIDTVLRLVDGTDRRLHTWTFDPVAETSPDRRRDYFARYVVRIPESVQAGGYRVEMAVTDTLAGATAETSLPLEISAD